MIIAALEREGIEAFMKGEYTAGFRAEAPSWPKVEVRELDYERARVILDSFETKQESQVEQCEVAVDSSFRKFCLWGMGVGFFIYFLLSILVGLTGSWRG